MMNLEGIFLTDISDPFDAPLRPSTVTTKPFYPKGGVSVDENQRLSQQLRDWFNL